MKFPTLRGQNVQFLQRTSGDNSYDYPGYNRDQLSETDYIHQHRGANLQCSCINPGRSSREVAKQASCAALACRIKRTRAEQEQPPKPVIHVGTIASSDMVLRAVRRFESEFNSRDVLGFDMEGGGVSRVTDCIVIKSAVDYGDTHKNKMFANYAAAAAAATAKAILMSLFHGSM